MISKLPENLQIAPELLSQELDGEMVLLDLDGGVYFGLDRMGTYVWHLLQKNSNVDMVYKTVLAEYDVEPDQLKKDLHTFFTALMDKGLIVSDLERPA